MCRCRRRPIFPGSCPPSIFGTVELNYRVRDGNGWNLNVIDTDWMKVLPLKQEILYHRTLALSSFFLFFFGSVFRGADLFFQCNRACFWAGRITVIRLNCCFYLLKTCIFYSHAAYTSTGKNRFLSWKFRCFVRKLCEPSAFSLPPAVSFAIRFEGDIYTNFSKKFTHSPKMSGSGNRHGCFCAKRTLWMFIF